MFSHDTSLTSLDLSSFDTSNSSSDMWGMFGSTYELKSIKLGSKFVFNKNTPTDLTDYNGSNPTMPGTWTWEKK